MRDTAEPAAGARAAAANLTGAPLALARAGWVVITVVSLGLVVVGMPLAYQQIITAQSGPQCADTRFSPAQFAYMHAAGVSPASIAVIVIAVQCYEILVGVGLGALLFWRRSESRIALLAATWLVLSSTVANDQHWLGAVCALRPIWPAAGLIFELLGVVGSLLGPVFWFTFPSGRWVPRWSPWLLLLDAPILLADALRPAPAVAFFARYAWVGNTAGGLLYATLLAAQVYRYRRISTPAERLQTRWVVLGGGIGLAGTAALIGGGAFGAYSPTAPWWPLFFRNVSWVIPLFSSLIPISIAIALLRSHLFDVDTLINRVLVYGSLTGVLGLLYLGGVVLLQRLTGQTQPLLVVLTTLAIAALVQPLRRALQRGIDRRFYRRKYDAARTLAAFSATLRDEVDLGQLRADLLAVVQETMQPRSLSLWLPAAQPAPPSEPPAGERAGR
ncbi:MAG TPA: hypothetical protein VGR57_00790 [Ktedonobacterales bacterium]|nr:hypothetical protein [Ktedonobacterales bacterium]